MGFLLFLRLAQKSVLSDSVNFNGSIWNGKKCPLSQEETKIDKIPEITEVCSNPEAGAWWKMKHGFSEKERLLTRKCDGNLTVLEKVKLKTSLPGEDVQLRRTFIQRT